jgi:HEAT repeat protein
MKCLNLLTSIGILFMFSCQNDETNKWISNLNSSDYNEKFHAINMLEDLKDVRSVEPLIYVALNDKSDQFRRMAVDALGSIGDPRAVVPLYEILSDNSANKTGILDENYKVESANDSNIELRISAANALGLIRDSTIIDSLIFLALFDKYDYISGSAILALANIGNKSIIESSWKYINFKDSSVVLRIFNILERLDYPIPINYLQDALKSKRPFSRLAAIKYISKTKSSLILPDLICLLDDPDFNCKIATIEAIGELREQEAVKPLIEKYRGNDLHIKIAVINSLIKIRGEQSIEFLFKIINDNNQTERNLAFDALGEIRDPSNIQKLLEYYDSDNWEIRYGVIKALGNYLIDDIVSNKVAEALDDPNFTVRRTAADILYKAGKHNVLMSAFESKNLVIIAHLYEYYMTRTLLIGKEDIYVLALNKYGGGAMATFFLNTNNPILNNAASIWAKYHGYKIEYKQIEVKHF